MWKYPDGASLLGQLPIQGGFDWYTITFFLVSWYTANAGYAAAAHLHPRTATAVLLCSALAVGLLLSGAVAPTARSLYRTARPLYYLSGMSPPVQGFCFEISRNSQKSQNSQKERCRDNHCQVHMLPVVLPGSACEIVAESSLDSFSGEQQCQSAAQLRQCCSCALDSAGWGSVF